MTMDLMYGLVTGVLFGFLLQKGGVHSDACGHAHHCDVEEVLLGSGVRVR